jgi:1-acyl-sn-glycerol-3-phosphate acyltransferase
MGLVTRVTGSAYAFFGLSVVLLGAALASALIWPFALLPRGRRERLAIHGARFFAWMCLVPAIFARLETRGLENLPAKRGYLVVCNHRSWVDVGLLIYYTLSQGISKKEVSYIPFFGLNGRLSGALFFDRSKPEDRAKVVEDALFLMRSGANLHVFPEGTRTRDGRLREKVHLRLVQESFTAGIDVVPACVWGTDDAVPATGFRVWPFQRVGLELARPLDRAGFGDAESYARATWDEVRRMAAAHGVQ